MFRSILLLVLLSGASGASSAAAGAEPVGTDPAGASNLPPAALVRATLAALPEVRAAEHQLRAASAERDRLRSGTQEWQVRASTTRRTVSGELNGAGPYQEWEIALERPWRSAGKAAIDEGIGASGMVHADAALGDAEHEAARVLLSRWFNVRRGDDEVAVLRTQEAAWARARQMVDIRARAGDAAQLDVDLAEAALAQAQTRLAQAQGRAARARTEFDRAYPELAGVMPMGPCVPLEPADLPASRLAELMADNHELAMVQAELDRRMGLAERARADRRPDPMFGLRLASERGGAEHLAGVTVTVPIGGDGRDAAMRAALAEVELAREHVIQVQRRLEGDLLGRTAEAKALFVAWQRSVESARRVEDAQARLRKAYALGEAGLAELLAGERQLQESRLAEAFARDDASEAYHRVQLDSHELWLVEDHPVGESTTPVRDQGNRR